MTRSFDDLISEAEGVSVEGWDFSWLDGRASEERPSWGYQPLMSQRLPGASAALDIATGGGEVLAGAQRFPPLMVATESWPPNANRAAALLHPRGVAVVRCSDPALPFAHEAFDLVVSRHPWKPQWSEIARVLRPGGTYFAQHVGPRTVYDLAEFFVGPLPRGAHKRDPDVEAAAATSVGLQVVDLRSERLRVEFGDVGAVVYFLRKVIWVVPDFTVERYRNRLLDLHKQIEATGPFVAYSSRTLVEARKAINNNEHDSSDK